MSWLDDITSSTHLSLSQLWEVVKDRGAWCAAFQACKELDMSERLNSNNCKEVSSLLHLCVYSIIYSYQHRVLFIIFYEVSIILLFLFLKLVQFQPFGEVFGWCLYSSSHPLGLFSYFLASKYPRLILHFPCQILMRNVSPRSLIPFIREQILIATSVVLLLGPFAGGGRKYICISTHTFMHIYVSTFIYLSEY